MTGRVSVYRMFIFLVAASYAVALSALPVDIFKDRLNYLAYVDNAWLLLSSNWGRGALSFLSNEPVWLLINGVLGDFFDRELALRIVIGIPAFIVSYRVLRSRPENMLWLLLFLLLPQVIKNHIIHLRQGWAIAVFLMAWFSHRRYVKYALFALTPLIHSSFFFVMAIYSLSGALVYLRLGASLRTIVYAASGLLVGVGLSVIGALLEARQIGEMAGTALEVSGLGFVFWLLILLLFKLQGRVFLRENAFAVGFLIFYLATYFLTVFSGRIFESCLMIVLLAGLNMSRSWRNVFAAMVVAYGAFGYFMNAGLPWFGFAANVP